MDGNFENNPLVANPNSYSFYLSSESLYKAAVCILHLVFVNKNTLLLQLLCRITGQYVSLPVFPTCLRSAAHAGYINISMMPCTPCSYMYSKTSSTNAI